MTAAPETLLADFARGHQAARVNASSRVAAGLLTAALYAVLVFLATHRTLWMGQKQAAPSEIVAQLMPDLPHKKAVQRVPPFLAHLIRPHAETPAPPVFTVASEAPVAPATLSASAAKSSPVAGGSPAGSGATGQAASGPGGAGNGTSLAGCWDPAWAQAVTDRVGHFLYIPRGSRHGVVFVHMVIRHSGWLDLLEIGTSSGDKALDRAAYNSVQRALPLPHIPDRMHASKIDANLPINFGNTGAHFDPTDGSCN
jgi:TonB family protein